MNDDKDIMRAMAAITRHIDAMHLILEGAEQLADARAIASVYVSRAAKILATLRVRGLTDRNEIDLLAEHFVLEAMRDDNAGTVKNTQGQELLTPADKAKVN